MITINIVKAIEREAISEPSPPEQVIRAYLYDCQHLAEFLKSHNPQFSGQPHSHTHFHWATCTSVSPASLQKDFFRMSGLNLPSFHLKLSDLVLILQALIKSLSYMPSVLAEGPLSLSTSALAYTALRLYWGNDYSPPSYNCSPA